MFVERAKHLEKSGSSGSIQRLLRATNTEGETIFDKLKQAQEIGYIKAEVYKEFVKVLDEATMADGRIRYEFNISYESSIQACGLQRSDLKTQIQDLSKDEKYAVWKDLSERIIRRHRQIEVEYNEAKAALGLLYSEGT